LPVTGSRSANAEEHVVMREYREGDVEAMNALDLECFEPAFRFSRRAMRRFAEARGAVTVLAEVEDANAEKPELVGFCIVQVEEQAGYVVTLDVAPGWRRQALARRLMEDAEARVQASGSLGMELHVSTGNLGAIAFYERIGYARVGMVEGFYGRGLDALVYVKRFAARV
jgi:ribosomal-protein-alanine N-acetyltransferase